MDATVPRGAAILLDFVSQPESRGRYDVIFGDHETGLPHPITTMTLDALMAAQLLWAKQWKSDAAGRYQIMRATLADLRSTLGLGATEVFSPDLQDRLGYALLKRRGYAAFRADQLTRQQYGLHLAQEWASLPVLVACKGAHRMLAPGDGYYRGDGLNEALVGPEQFDAALTLAHAAAS